MTTLDLLQHWSRLEPDRCQESNSEFFNVSFAQGLWTVRAYPNLPMHEICSARLQHAVQVAIVSHSLIYRLESATNGNYYASVVESAVGSYDAGQDTEAAVALLRAYLGWLEHKAGGEG